MEGFFRAREYAILENIDYNTAMQRVHRNDVLSFKEPRSGFVYIYWTDENSIVPENYISINDYAHNHNAGRDAVLRRIREGRIKQEDLFIRVRGVGKRKEIFINKDASFILYTPTERVEMNRPEGYLSIRTWCEKNNVSINNARQMVLKKRINCIRHNDHVYIPENEPIPKHRPKGMGVSLATITPDGFLPLKKWCKKYNENYWHFYRECLLGKFPCARLQRTTKYFVFIKDMPKEEIINDYKAGVS